MNSNEKKRWIDSVMTSMEGSQRAKPPIDLFEKIQEGIHKKTGKVVSMPFLALAAAASVLLLIFNINVMRSVQSSPQAFDNPSHVSADEGLLISDYMIYEL